MSTTKILEAATVLVSAATVGEMLGGKHPITLWRWCKAGSFPMPFYVGNQRRWRLADVEAWIAEQAMKRHGPHTAEQPASP